MLQVEHIYKTFFPGTINEKKALVDTTLHLKPGDFTTVIGRQVHHAERHCRRLAH